MRKQKELKQFKIPSIFGIHPGAVALIVIVLIFILLGVIPSLFHSGRRVHFSSNCYPLALEIDEKDTYMIPGDAYLKSGKHNIRVKYGSQILKEDTIKVRKSLFYSWLFEGKKKVYVDIDRNSINKDAVIDAVIRNFLEDASHYATVFEETPSKPIRPIYSELKTLLGDDEIKNIPTVMDEASRLISSETLSNDAKSVGLNIQAPTFENGEIIDHNRSLKRMYKLQALDNIKSSLLGINGIKLWNGDKLNIQANETTEKEWGLFVKENPYWDVSNISELIKNGLVDEYYMKGFENREDKAMVNVSPLSVKAYTEWLSKKSRKNVRLLSTDEYIFYSYLFKDFDNTLTKIDDISGNKLNSILGGVWEMTSTVFEPQYYRRDYDNTDYVRSDFAEFKKYDIPLSIELFGGCSYNSKYDTDTLRSLRGVMLPSITGDAIGFRVCWED